MRVHPHRRQRRRRGCPANLRRRLHLHEQGHRRCKLERARDAEGNADDVFGLAVHAQPASRQLLRVQAVGTQDPQAGDARRQDAHVIVVDCEGARRCGGHRRAHSADRARGAAVAVRHAASACRDARRRRPLLALAAVKRVKRDGRDGNVRRHRTLREAGARRQAATAPVGRLQLLLPLQHHGLQAVKRVAALVQRVAERAPHRVARRLCTVVLHARTRVRALLLQHLLVARDDEQSQQELRPILLFSVVRGKDAHDAHAEDVGQERKVPVQVHVRGAERDEAPVEHEGRRQHDVPRRPDLREQREQRDHRVAVALPAHVPQRRLHARRGLGHHLSPRRAVHGREIGQPAEGQHERRGRHGVDAPQRELALALEPVPPNDMRQKHHAGQRQEAHREGQQVQRPVHVVVVAVDGAGQPDGH
mmetsp:Transcript_3727/g.13751  ORF Transcript_3727/g.13751 Transcript_3727/m.13751 type:complete len:420 (+) Transcript_3727:3802-5061(+)